MSPGLNHFIEGKDDTSDQTSSSEEERDEKAESINIDYNWSKNSGNVDYNADKNICPRCMTVGGKSDGLGWECPNDECSTVAYGKGWHQWMMMGWNDDIEFLDSIDWVNIIERLNKRD